MGIKELKFCKPEESAPAALKGRNDLPIPVTDSGSATGGLLGIVMAFDLL